MKEEFRENVIMVSKKNLSRVVTILNQMADQGLVERTFNPDTEEYFYHLHPDWKEKIKIISKDK